MVSAWGPAGKPSGFRSLLGYCIVDWRDGFAEIHLTLDERHKNSMGAVHGGLYATLIDAACGHAATWCSAPSHVRVCVTVSLTTSFLATVPGGLIVTRAHLERVDNRIAICRAETTDGTGRVLTVGQGSFLYLPGHEDVAGVARTPPR
jgi:uncharacterized protein (TIGR00369 family)